MSIPLTRWAAWIVAVSILTAAEQSVADDSSDDTRSASRPRIGLVLAGGGAKGAAHVGVLKVLDELRIPIDCVTGTSMGALVGAGFAAGATPEEIEELILGVNWTHTFGSGDIRQATEMHRKTTGVTYSNSLELGLKDGKIVVPGGLMRTQQVEELLRDLVERARLVTDFDKLPLPFRAIATNMRTGKMVVLSGGDLSVAMRASMAVPGVFAPVVLKGEVLADGGMVRNLPVDIARDLCADVIIASSLETPEPKPEELVSALQLIGRSMDVMIHANVATQLETMTEDDVVIHVQMGEFGSGDFNRAAEIIPLGDLAAREVAEQLRRYALPEDEYLAWRSSVTEEERQTITVAAIDIVGADRVNPEYVRSKMRSVPGVPMSQEDLTADTSRIYAMGDFEKVEYQLVGDPNNPALEIDLQEKSWGPNFLSLDLGLYASVGGETSFVLRGEHQRTWVNSRGGEWQNVLQFGRTSILSSMFYQPIDKNHRFFIQPGFHFWRSLEDIYNDGHRIARFDLTDTYFHLDSGFAIGDKAELRAGIRYGIADASSNTGALSLAGFHDLKDAGWTANFIYDSRDAPFVPTRGSLTRINYMRTDSGLGSEASYELLEVGLVKAFPLRGNALYLGAFGGTNLDSELPAYRQFLLGGPRSFSGFEIGELRGQEYWTTSVVYLHKLADLQSLLGQALYAGVRLQAGEMRQRVDGIDDGTLYGGALMLGGRTPLGSLSLTVGATNTGSYQIYLNLGRPIEEGSIIDVFE